jgi:D-glycero-alpha-D-manno-heptose-7-phosphate kinase
MTGHLYRAKAPLRVSFAGGGTDVPPFPEQEGGLVLSSTINRCAHGTLRPRDDQRIAIESLDLGVAASYRADEPLEKGGDLALVKAAIRRVGVRDGQGFDLFLDTAAPPGSGLGSSSAMMVALIGLLASFYRQPLTSYEIAELAFRIERVDLGLKGGLQDQYASTFGGFNYIEFEADRVIVNPLRIGPDTIAELEYNLLLGFTGATRSSDHIIEDQTARYETRDEDTLAGLREQKQLATAMKNALLRGDTNGFGELLGEAWNAKRRMSPRITNDFIDEAYDAAMREGALGGKVTGAGGGGYMLFYCRYDRKHRVAEALTELGVKITDFAFDHDGLTRWSPRDE